MQADSIEQLEAHTQALLDAYRALKQENSRLKQQNEAVKTSLTRVIEHLQTIEDEL